MRTSPARPAPPFAVPTHRQPRLSPPSSPPPQEAGTYHVRTTILPPEADMAVVTRLFKEFHSDFMARYKNGGNGNGANGAGAGNGSA